MTDITQGATAAPEIPVVSLPDNAPEKFSISQAARALQSVRFKDIKEAVAPVKAAAEPEQQSEAAAAAEDAAPVETQAPGETESADPPETLAPIEAPRSWTAEDKELFQSLPRETQERLAERERSRERDFRRSQDEAAEKLKGLTAKEQAVEQARQQYETALPQLLNNLQYAQAGEFADVKTIADVERLAREDWPRYLQWDVAQKKIAAVTQEMLQAQQRQGQEKMQRFTEFARKEDDLFVEKVPDMADAVKAEKLQKAAVSLLKDVGFTEGELGASWNGEKDISLRDHRVQLLIRDATLWREAQAKAKTATTKPVPPVQRPGAAPAQTTGAHAEIQNLTKQLETATGMNAHRIGARLIAARRAAAAR
jgi:hypothetical protein